jgi:hypothetical protein
MSGLCRILNGGMMRNKIIASLITLGVLGLVVLLFYGVMFHKSFMEVVGLILVIIGIVVCISGVAYMIWKFVYDLLEGG